MANVDGDTPPATIPAVATLLTINIRTQALLVDINQAEMDFATSTVLGERLVAIPGRFFNPDAVATRPELIVLLELRIPADYIIATCKHECAIMKQSRNAK